jgi:hypothetical protein
MVDVGYTMAKRIQVPGRCIFCGATGLSKEHVWADWLKAYIPKDMAEHSSMSALLHPTHADRKTKKIAGDPRSRRLRVVCRACNNEWMSRLQTATKPYLLPLVLGEVTALDVNAQATLAAWIAMFVMVAEHFDRAKVATPQSERDFLRKREKTPSTWRIWIGDYERGNWVGHWIHFAVPISGESHPIEMMSNGVPRPNTQTTTFVVGRLYVHVMSSPMDIFDDWRFAKPELMKQIWPIKRNIVGWPPKTLSDRDADGIAAAFFLKSEEIARREALARDGPESESVKLSLAFVTSLGRKPLERDRFKLNRMAL